MLKLWFIALAVTLGSGAGMAAEQNGAIKSAADLSSACNVASSSAVCSAYITGYTQGFYYASVSAKAGLPGCVPHGLDDGQARVIVTQFMSHHLEMANQGAPSVVAEALLSAFPCAAPDRREASRPAASAR